jgi:hypothetical protein
MAAEQSEWEQFCETASAVMRDALQKRITLEEATEFFENNKSISSVDVRRYTMYTMWEIDGSRESYLELLKLFESRSSEAELARYIGNRGHHWPWN